MFEGEWNELDRLHGGWSDACDINATETTRKPIRCANADLDYTVEEVWGKELSRYIQEAESRLKRNLRDRRVLFGGNTDQLQLHLCAKCQCILRTINRHGHSRWLYHRRMHHMRIGRCHNGSRFQYHRKLCDLHGPSFVF